MPVIIWWGLGILGIGAGLAAGGTGVKRAGEGMAQPIEATGAALSQAFVFGGVALLAYGIVKR